MSQPILLSIVMPAYNEAETIADTLRTLIAGLDEAGVAFEIIAVNDASGDDTLGVLERIAAAEPRVRPITNAGPNGYGFAIRKGLEVYRGDAAVVVTADGSDAPKDVVAYARIIESGKDCAFGSRFVKGAKVTGYPGFKLFINRLANACIGAVLGVRYGDFTNGFKCYRRSVIDSMQPLISGQFNITIEMTVKALQGGWRYDVAPTDWTQRTAGKSSFNIFKMLKPYGATLLYCLTLHYLRGVRR